MGQTVVVTGSTRGLGFGLAKAFLARGCSVVVHGRSKVDEACAKLVSPERVLGVAGDIADAAAVRALWDAAVKRFGRVDVWINNAGTGTQQLPLVEQGVEAVANIVRTNLVGTVLGTRIALEGMVRQGGGQVFNMEGLGSNPRFKRKGSAVYGSTKCATRYFTQNVAMELEGSKVRVGTLSPGVVVTELLISQFDGVPAADWERSKKRYNRMADTVDTVAPYLAERVLANDRNGAAIAWISPLGMLARMVSPFRGSRDVLSGMPPPKVV